MWFAFVTDTDLMGQSCHSFIAWKFKQLQKLNVNLLRTYDIFIQELMKKRSEI